MNLRFIHKGNGVCYLLMASLVMSCTDALDTPYEGSVEEVYQGERILFTVGTTENSVSTRADGDDDSKKDGYTVTPGKTYYMPKGYRFVCRMYYKSATGSELYDVTGGSDETAWLMVDDDPNITNVGNSLYRLPSYAIPSVKDEYGNDDEATCFYWQNRKEHAFLAWLDLNKALTNDYNPTKNSGSLKFEPEDYIYPKHTNRNESQWVLSGYQVFGAPKEFASWSELRTFFETGTNYESYVKGKVPEGIDPSSYADARYYYDYGWSCKFSRLNATTTLSDALHMKYGWIQYQMFYNQLAYSGEKTGANILIRKIKDIPTYLFDQVNRKYLAKIDIKYLATDESGNLKDPEQNYTIMEGDVVKGTTDAPALETIQDGDQIINSKLLCCKELDAESNPVYYEINADGSPKLDAEGNKIAYSYVAQEGDKEVDVPVGENTYKCISRTIHVAQAKWFYYETDDYGNERYDETNPRYTFYYQELSEKKDLEVIENLPCNAYDLTRGEGSEKKTSILQQPDICQALTKQEPSGATQSSNRVNLYFKHQFSMVQVNIKGSSDLSVVIDKDHITKVELLGVSEKGYVFTELNENGDVEPTTYESVDVSKYSDAHLSQNQWGTSFEMFDMYDASKAPSTDNPDGNYGYQSGYLKSYNALTFGQLQAIRITWNEAKDGTGIEHVSTYHVASDDLRNLHSGYKYIWNIELRRGTLAIVRTEIVDWIVPAIDAEGGSLEYTTDGTITN